MKIKERSWRVLSGIARMYSAIHDTLFGSSAYDMLDGLHRKQISINTELSGEVGRLRHQNAQLSGQLEQRISELKTLEARQGVLNNLLAVTRRDINETLEVAYEVRTAGKAIKARAVENAGTNNALAKWQKAYADPLEKRLKAAEQEAAALRGVAFSKAIDVTLKRDSRAMQIPFAYYGFATHKLYYTPAALEFLGEKNNKADLTLAQLMYPIRKEDRMGIIESLRSGKGLKHHKVLASSGKELRLTTKPFFYDKNAIGVAIFLYDARFSVAGIRDNLMYRRLNKIFYELSAQFDAIKEKAKAGKLQPEIV